MRLVERSAALLVRMQAAETRVARRQGSVGNLMCMLAPEWMQGRPWYATTRPGDRHQHRQHIQQMKLQKKV